jgi:hypothetical protein
MSSKNQGFIGKAAMATMAGRLLILLAVIVFAPVGVLAQSPSAPAKSGQSTSSATDKGDRWLHVRVICEDPKGETVRVNVPLELAEKVLPAVNHDRLHNGKVKIDRADMNDVDLRTIMDAIRTTKDGEFVTVQSTENDVRVAKESNHLIIHVVDKSGAKRTQVEIKVPMKVVDALFSAGKDELDLVAALHALGAQGDTELVSVKDSDNTVKVWLDSKNVSE